MKHVILCDEKGNPIGTADVETAHEKPLRHRAFSVVLFDQHGKETLIQQRVRKKLFGGLWANACCSHPQKDDGLTEAAKERTREECGFPCPPLQALFSFEYKAEDPEKKGWEWEYDTVLVGNAMRETSLKPNPREVAALRWMNLEELKQDLSPEKYAPWFIIAMKRILGMNDG